MKTLTTENSLEITEYKSKGNSILKKESKILTWHRLEESVKNISTAKSAQ